MQRHHEQHTTIAILGSDTVVGRTLCVLLESHGYQTILLDSHPTGVVDELLDGAHLLLMTPRVDKDVRNAFLAAMGISAPQKGGIPVIALSTTVIEEAPQEGVVRMPWPTDLDHLVESIEATLSSSAASTSPTNQAGTA